MGSRFTADHARKAVEEARALYSPKEVYVRIEMMAGSGNTRAIFSKDRWSDELNEMLAEDGYGLQVVPRASGGGSEVYVTWGRKPRRLRETE